MVLKVGVGLPDPGVAPGALPCNLAAEPGGTTSTWPVKIRVGSVMQFACANSCTLIPIRLLMWNMVSPERTIYVSQSWRLTHPPGVVVISAVISTGVSVDVGVSVGVSVKVSVNVAVSVGVSVNVGVNEGVSVGVSVKVGVRVGVR